MNEKRTTSNTLSYMRAIEDPRFPFERFSEIAEMESWRKEVNRPIYHVHKWWAQRLGPVFRAILLGVFSPAHSDPFDLFYKPVRLTGAVVFDPFMGSGTTLGEALKLGARAIGRDINPVAHFAVRNALRAHSRQDVLDTFHAIERDAAPTIKRFYRTELPGSGPCEVLYYFWVKIVPCPRCNQNVDLFTSYVFAQHADAKRNPEARAVCPGCGAINTVRYNAHKVSCTICSKCFDPSTGPAKGQTATCPHCCHAFPIAKTVRALGAPPQHRLYAKMVLKPGGSKEYLAPDDHDRALYREAAALLRKRENPYPIAPIEPGYNTDQVLNYCYTHWHQMFNDRQLLCLSLLAERIRAIPEESLRELFTGLFSGTLEFNNMFASFKGEGTGAVRHMFSHHILKPERVPLEANLWGTAKSSGSFSTLFKSRILRALDYAEHPFEIRLTSKNGKMASDKVYGLSCPLAQDVAGNWSDFKRNKALYLSCGDSATTDLPAESVDAVVTDPPFFDNVHYSQLADFFYIWQRHILGKNGIHQSSTTRSSKEVQQSDRALFTERLTGVWKECYRVLPSDGLLVFTYHHSRPEGWQSILRALLHAGFRIVATHPIKSEMSVAAPKQQAKEPIDLDIIMVCRKRDGSLDSTPPSPSLIAEAAREARSQIARFSAAGRYLSRNDVRVVIMAHLIKRLSWLSDSVVLRYLDSMNESIESLITALHSSQQIHNTPTLFDEVPA